MTTEQIHDTIRLDAWLAAQRERDYAMSKAAVYHARAESHRQMWKPMLAGAAGAAMVVAAVWVAMPKFKLREIELPVINITRSDVDVPNIVKRDVTIDVEKSYSRGATPAESASESLAPKVPTASEMAFIQRPDYQSAEWHGRIAGPRGNGFIFDTGKTMQPAKLVDGRIVELTDVRDVVDPFIGDYAYCNKDRNGLFNCSVIHEGVIQPIPLSPITTLLGRVDQLSKAADPSAEFSVPPTASQTLNIQPPMAGKKTKDCARAPMAGSCAR